MAITGLDILSDLYDFTKIDVKKWFTKAIPNAVDAVRRAYSNRNEVVKGGITSDGTGLAAGNLNVSMTQLESILGGKIMSDITLANVDLLAAAGSVGQPIFADGADASAFLLGSDETAKCALIVCDSDGAGGENGGDAGTPLVVLVVAGTAAAYDGLSAFPTSVEIQAALEASTAVHDGVVSWQHVAQIDFTNPSGVPTLGHIPNRNNSVGV